MTVASFEDVVRAGQKTRELPTLGSLSWWSIANVRIPISDVRARFEALGLPTDKIEDRKPKVTFTKACGQLREASKFVRACGCNEERVAVAVIAEELVEEEDPRYTVEGRVAFERASTSIVATNDILHQKADAAYREYLTTWDADDIRNLLLDIVRNDLGAIGLRPNGGVYFTHREHDQVLDKITKFVAGLGTDSVYFTLGIADAEDARENLFTVMQDEMRRDLAVAAQEVEKLLSGESKTRPKTLADRISSFKAASAKAAMYEGLLHLQADDIHQELEALTAKVAKGLSDLMSAA